jgi:hypothetical protein
MQLQRLAWSVLACFSVCAAAQADDIVPKQLSGTPDEFAALAPLDPAAAAIGSKSALIPVRMAAAKARDRGTWQGELPVENGKARFLVFAAGEAGWDMELLGPDGSLKPARDLGLRSKRVPFGIEGAAHEADLFEFDAAASGMWTLKLTARDAAANEGYVLIEGDEATELSSWQTHQRQLIGERIGLAGVLALSDEAGTRLGAAAGRIERATLRVVGPDGIIETFAMYDDGRHGDGRADDGVVGGEFVARTAGQYLASVLVRGTDRNGQPLLRSAEHVVPVVEASIALAGPKAAARAGSGTRLAIEIPVDAHKRSQHYRAYAEVWGRDAKGRALPVAWVGGMATPADGKLTLGFDERWVARVAARPPFELRNVRIEDPDYFVTLAETPGMPLALPALRAKLAPSQVGIDESMRMGPRPPALRSKGVGSRLLLVHGYCSGGVWPASQFSNASSFADYHQNRTHDQFARLIQSFGSPWNSFGVVAHSQGGAAALHLYHYYWSGLDNAAGSRLIQSVGTPYQGTNLAGILATLGSWFGVGCGTNGNLSYSGASSWLAGISSGSRSKVNYYTTAFRTTNWWTNDYCNAATDLVLSDPEDGTTEQAYGQLPGAVNRGHTSGQCHTTGMRDPAQYLDATRNATMNANAAR